MHLVLEPLRLCRSRIWLQNRLSKLRTAKIEVNSMGYSQRPMSLTHDQGSQLIINNYILLVGSSE